MWDVTIEPRASVARCYECGSSPQIDPIGVPWLMIGEEL